MVGIPIERKSKKTYCTQEFIKTLWPEAFCHIPCVEGARAKRVFGPWVVFGIFNLAFLIRNCIFWAFRVFVQSPKRQNGNFHFSKAKAAYNQQLEPRWSAFRLKEKTKKHIARKNLL